MPKKTNNFTAGNISKIAQNGLEELAISLSRAVPKLSCSQIAEELNAAAQLSGREAITVQNVTTFQKATPSLRKEMLLANKQHMRKLMLEGVEFDMLRHLKEMAARTSFMIDSMEDIALNEGELPNPYHYKSLNSELRETLKQIETIHKEVYDMEVVREFLTEVIKTLKDVSPEALSQFVDKMKGKRDSSRIVSELLNGGL